MRGSGRTGPSTAMACLSLMTAQSGLAIGRATNLLLLPQRRPSSLLASTLTWTSMIFWSTRATPLAPCVVCTV